MLGHVPCRHSQIRLVVEAGLSDQTPMQPKEITTPGGALATRVGAASYCTAGDKYAGLESTGQFCGVTVMRAGEAMERGLRECCTSVRVRLPLPPHVCQVAIGHILIQQHASSSAPQVFYSKLPSEVATQRVLLLDPVLSAIRIAASPASRRRRQRRDMHCGRARVGRGRRAAAQHHAADAVCHQQGRGCAAARVSQGA